MTERTEHVRMAVQRAGPMRVESLMGREFRVFPAVLVKSQVLHNNLGRAYLPPEEVFESVDAWNNIPVTVGHPQGSARDPRTLNTSGVGYIFRASAEQGSLRGEVWLDMDRIRQMPDVGEMVRNAEAGEIGEVSTGFTTLVRQEPGEHNGQRYDVVMTHIQPDHLALLPGGRGACSVADGCGLARNCAGECDCGCGGEPMAAEHDDQETGGEVQETGEAANAATDNVATEGEGNMAEPTEGSAQEAQNETDTVRALRAELRAARAELADLRARSQYALQQEEAERVRIVEEIVANRRNPWTESEIDAMNIAELRKVHAALGADRAVNYAGRGGPRGGGYDTSFVRDIMGPNNSVLVQKGGD